MVVLSPVREVKIVSPISTFLIHLPSNKVCVVFLVICKGLKSYLAASPHYNTSSEQHWFINTRQGFYKPSSISPLNTSLPHPTHSVSKGMVSHKCDNYSGIKDVFRSLAGHYQSTLCFAWSIVNSMEWLWRPLDFSVIRCMLWFFRCMTCNSIPIILILMTNKNVILIYSNTICEQKAKDCALSGSFHHKLQHCGFYLWW